MLKRSRLYSVRKAIGNSLFRTLALQVAHLSTTGVSRPKDKPVHPILLNKMMLYDLVKILNKNWRMEVRALFFLVSKDLMILLSVMSIQHAAICFQVLIPGGTTPAEPNEEEET